MDNPTKPSALLLISPQCSHCPAVMEGLLKLLKSNKLGKVEIVNLFEHPEIAAELGVRSVPWTRIGPFDIEGAHSYAELEQWAEEAAQPVSTTHYYRHLLENRQLEKAISLIKAAPDSLTDLLPLLASVETPISIRIGVGAVLEEFTGEEPLNWIVPGLITLTESEQQQIRADACHYLSLSNDHAALTAIRGLENDPDPEIREIAAESAAALSARLKQ
ncbi:MAG: thioredoxin family protein [Chromatiales bacterium]|nr:thioredoxin family protein [Chromatiales bacterium]